MAKKKGGIGIKAELGTILGGFARAKRHLMQEINRRKKQKISNEHNSSEWPSFSSSSPFHSALSSNATSIRPLFSPLRSPTNQSFDSQQAEQNYPPSQASFATPLRLPVSSFPETPMVQDKTPLNETSTSENTPSRDTMPEQSPSFRPSVPANSPYQDKVPLQSSCEPTSVPENTPLQDKMPEKSPSELAANFQDKIPIHSNSELVSANTPPQDTTKQSPLFRPSLPLQDKIPQSLSETSVPENTPLQVASPKQSPSLRPSVSTADSPSQKQSPLLRALKNSPTLQCPPDSTSHAEETSPKKDQGFTSHFNVNKSFQESDSSETSSSSDDDDVMIVETTNRPQIRSVHTTGVSPFLKPFKLDLSSLDKLYRVLILNLDPKIKYNEVKTVVVELGIEPKRIVDVMLINEPEGSMSTVSFDKEQSMITALSYSGRATHRGRTLTIKDYDPTWADIKTNEEDVD